MEIVGYRWADYDTPLWVNPNRSPGRWHAVGDDPTQYWSLHPLGPWAEYARNFALTEWADLSEVRSRMWAARLIFEPGDLVEVDFDNAHQYGITAEQLVGVDYRPCQLLAQHLRPDHRGLIVPSAALPGTNNVVLFGGRTMSPYDRDPPDADLDIPASMLTEHGGPPKSLTDLVCHRGTDHVGLRAWQAGDEVPK